MGTHRTIVTGCVAALIALTAVTANTWAEAEKDAAAPAPTAPPVTMRIALDTSGAPEMAGWARLAARITEDAYPVIVRELGVDGYRAPDSVQMVVVRNDKDVAWASGPKITVASKWFTDRPEDVGALVHEMAHVVQQYTHRGTPGWVTEGIADYVRWFVWEPPHRRPRINPDHAKYTDSYQTTGAFLAWIVANKDADFVRKLNTDCRAGRYDVSLFEKYAGAPVEKLWDEFVASERAKRKP
ncbi:MAG: hypothetical protein GC159_12485 [Phycisphaera sp.]|nr:hypothetical protein [Phycisphaera sp.]